MQIVVGRKRFVGERATIDLPVSVGHKISRHNVRA
jgi:hypothetical protein